MSELGMEVERGTNIDVMKELIVTIFSITALAGLLIYLIRQSVWTRYVLPLISRKPKLSILFENGQNVLHIKKTTPRSLDEALREAMAVEIQEHPYEHYTEPSYQNPFPQIYEGSSNNKKIYNDLLGDYLKEKEAELRNCLQSQISDEYMQPVKLVLCNDGVVASGNLDITIRITPNNNVYQLSAKIQKEGECIEPPVLMPEGWLPLLDYHDIPYSYTEWQQDAYVANELKYEIKPINHHKHDENALSPLYIDTRISNKISIKITIVDSTVHAPYESEIILWVDD